VIYTSALLFHGPGARVEALRALPQIGRRVAEPFGEDGLKVDDTREIIKLMQDAPLGDEPGVILIGPMDRAESKSTDVLLKTIEEFDHECVRPVLYAYDLGSVSSTIKSRCILRWCPDAPPNPEGEEAMKLAFDLVEASCRQDRARVIELLKEKKAPDVVPILESCANVLALNPEFLVGVRHELWLRVRNLARYRHVGKTELLATFVGGVCPG